MLFLGGSPPVDPGPSQCGPDKTEDALTCQQYSPPDEALRCTVPPGPGDLFRDGTTNIDIAVGFAITLADLDGDGAAELLLGGQSSGLTILSLGADGRLAEVATLSSSGIFDFASGDFNGDGRVDVTVLTDSSTLFLLDGMAVADIDAAVGIGVAAAEETLPL